MRERDWGYDPDEEDEELGWEDDEEFILSVENIVTEFRCSDCTFIFIKKNWGGAGYPPCPCCGSAHVSRQSSWYEPS